MDKNDQSSLYCFTLLFSYNLATNSRYNLTVCHMLRNNHEKLQIFEI